MGIFASKKAVEELTTKTENSLDEVTTRISENIRKFNEDIKLLDKIIEETTLQAQENNLKLEALALESSFRTERLNAQLESITNKQKVDSVKVAKMAELHELMDTFLRTNTCYASANLQIYPKYDAYRKKYGLPKSVRKGNGKSIVDCYE